MTEAEFFALLPDIEAGFVEAVRVLQFYADLNNYQPYGLEDMSTVDRDRGAMARKALGPLCSSLLPPLGQATAGGGEQLPLAFYRDKN